MQNGLDIEVRYWSKYKPIPEGWKLLRELADCHHGEWSVIITKIDTKEIGTWNI